VPKIAEAVRAARREQIIAAGLACFAGSGYHVTTMADVAAHAGVSKGTPYLYFDSKEALFLALHEKWDCGAGERVDTAIAALSDGSAARRAPSCTRSRPRSPRTSRPNRRPAGCYGGAGTGRARADHRRGRAGCKPR